MNRIAVSGWLASLLACCCVAQQGQSSNSSAPTPPQAQSSEAPRSKDQSPEAQSTEDQSPPAKAASGPQASSPANSSAADPSKPASQSASGNTGDAEESSSRDTRTDIRPPKDDAKAHPNSQTAVDEMESSSAADGADVQEFHPWNPMKAMEDVEVGDYYFKRKNYKAALDRYKEALYYKHDDAVATFKLAVCQEKLGDKAAARKNFEQYLKILPEGPYAKDARASLGKLAAKENSNR